MKRLMCTAIILALSFVIGIGAEARSIEDKTMSLSEAVTIAKENSRQAVIDSLDIRKKKIQLKKAKENADNLGTAYGYENILNNNITREVRVMEAENAVTIAEMTAADNMKKLEQDVYRVFMNILLAEKELELAIEKKSISEEKYNIVKAMNAAGTAAGEQLSNAEYDLYSKTADIEVKKGRLDQLDLELKRLLNFPYDSKIIEIEGVIEMVPFTEVDIEKLIDEQKDAGTEIFIEECSLNAAIKTMELTKEFFIPGTDIYDQNEISLNAAYRNLDAAKRNREVKIRSTYNELLNLIDGIKLAEEYEKLQQKKFSNTQNRYDKGQISKELLLTSKEGYLDAVYRKIKAIYDVNIKKYEFDALIIIK